MKRRAFYVVTALAMSVGVAATTGAHEARAATVPRTTALLALNYYQPDHLGNVAAANYAWIALQGNRDDRVPTVHTNSGTKALHYLNVGATHYRSPAYCASAAGHPSNSYSVATDYSDYAYGVNYCWLVATNRLNWILRANAAGNRTDNFAAYCDDQTRLAMDTANSAYRTTFGDDAITAATTRTNPFDGLYLDDVNTHPGHGLDQTSPPNCTTGSPALHLYTSGGAAVSDVAYGSATTEFTKSVGGRLRAAGLVVAANVAVNPWNSDQNADVAAMAPRLSYVNREFFSQWPASPLSPPSNPEAGECGPYQPMDAATVASLQNYARQIQAIPVGTAGNHARFAALDYGRSTAMPTPRDKVIMSFGRASFLLTWNGEPGSVSIFRPCGDVDPADKHWTTYLGLPTAAAVVVKRDANNTPIVQTRTFQNGIVAQNMGSATTYVHVTGTYIDQNNQTWTDTNVPVPGAAPGAQSDSCSDTQVCATPGGAELLTKMS